MFKKLTLINFLLCLIGTSSVFAQNVGINNDNSNPDASSILDLKANDKGLLIPRISLTMRNLAAPITAPATALLVYNTAAVNDVNPGFYYWTGTQWSPIAADNLGNHTATTNIQLDGNRLTNNGTGGISIDNAGNVGIGITTPAAKLDVDGTIKTGQNGTSGALQLYSEQGATDYTYTIRPNPAAIQNNTYTLPTNSGSAGQVLTTDGTGNFYWSTPSGGSGIIHALEAHATMVQTINVGVSITDGTGTIRFDNEVVTNTALGTWTNDSLFNVLQAGLYLIDAHVTSTQTGSNASAIAPYIEVRNIAAPGVAVVRIFGVGITQLNAFHTSTRGRGEVQGLVRLQVGDTVRIRCNNISTAVNAPISTQLEQTRISIVKLL